MVVLLQQINGGQGTGIRTGLASPLKQSAKASVTFNTDGQHQSCDVATSSIYLSNIGVDIVLRSRFLGSPIGTPFHRQWLLHLAVRLTRLATVLRVTDMPTGACHDCGYSYVTCTSRRPDGARLGSTTFRFSFKCSYVKNPVTTYYHRKTLAIGKRTRDAWSVLIRLVISRWFAQWEK